MPPQQQGINVQVQPVMEYRVIELPPALDRNTFIDSMNVASAEGFAPVAWVTQPAPGDRTVYDKADRYVVLAKVVRIMQVQAELGVVVVPGTLRNN